MGIFTNLGALLRTGDTTYNGSTYSKPMQEALDVSQSNENYLANWFRSVTGSGLTDAQRQANAFTASREDLAWMREMDASNTQYQRAVADMQAAGINPLMAVSNGGASVPAASSSGSVTPGSSPLNLGSLIQSITGIGLASKQKEALQSEIDLKEAEASKIKSETSGIDFDNEVKRLTKEATIEAAELKNAVSRSNLKIFDKKLDEIDANIEHLKQTAATEESKRDYNLAQSILASANAYSVLEILPYEKAYRDAATENEKQQSLLAAAHAMYQNKLINDGYLDAFINNEKAVASSAESKAELDLIKSAIRTGDYSKVKHHYGLASDVLSTVAILLDNFNPLNGLIK